VRDKAELDDLMVGELCSRVRLPAPDPAQWKAQAIDVCRQLRDQYLRYPEIWRATLAAAPHSPDTLRIYEGLLAILMAGGVPLQPAAWAGDAAFLYIGAYSVMSLRRQVGQDDDGPAVGRAEAIERLRMLPPDRFPTTSAHAPELVSGEGHDRFEFTLGLLFGGLLGGVLTQTVSWRWCLYVNLVIAAVAFAGALAWLRDGSRPERYGSTSRERPPLSWAWSGSSAVSGTPSRKAGPTRGRSAR
jgi:Tetracyclin repressor-like, C-terminal domain